MPVRSPVWNESPRLSGEFRARKSQEIATVYQIRAARHSGGHRSFVLVPSESSHLHTVFLPIYGIMIKSKMLAVTMAVIVIVSFSSITL